MKLLYFAYLRDRAGIGEESVSPPVSVGTVGELIDWLKGVDSGRAKVFEDMSIVRVAVNQEYAAMDRIVSADDEVAFFPPVTGG